MDLLKQLSETPGASGREQRIRDLIRSHVESVCDRVEVDALGNLIAFKAATVKGAEPPKRVMVSCHMDEIAFYVRSIDDEGFIRLQEVGGFDTRNLFARQVLIQGREDLYGVMNPSGPPVHIASEEAKKKIPRIIDFFVDTGLGKDEVRAKVKPGDPVTLVQTFRTLGKLATGKCLDNRAACWVGIRTLEQLKSSPYDLYVAFTVQEEVGLRGAKTCAFSIAPDIGVAVDVTLAVDVPGIPKEEAVATLGKGVAIKIMDSSAICDPGLVDDFVRLAEAGKITHQMEILPRGGTDAGGIQMTRGGVRVITLSIPCRYIHTATEVIHQDDLKSSADLLLAFLQP
jgi:tetrahedral aminopeptidase